MPGTFKYFCSLLIAREVVSVIPSPEIEPIKAKSYPYLIEFLLLEVVLLEAYLACFSSSKPLFILSVRNSGGWGRSWMSLEQWSPQTSTSRTVVSTQVP